MDEKDRECLKDLRTTDPRHDKKRIEETKGGLLKDSYKWILKNLNYQTWRNDQKSRLLWINGDPGKGKTMLLCGVVSELEKSKARTENISYFFCQATDARLNNAIAVLRGLVYLLIIQQPSLISHIRKTYDHASKALFEDANAWVALTEVFTGIMQDPGLNTTYLVVDALDECEKELDKLLDFIVQNVSLSANIKWLLSSRNRLDIEQKLRDVQMRLSLELKGNAEQVSYSIDMYINDKLSHLESLKDDDNLRDQVRDILHRKAAGTFLWVALVVQELQNPDNLDVLRVVKDVPTGLDEYYNRMVNQIQLNKRNAGTCWRILAMALIAYRPLFLAEVSALSEMSGGTKIIAKIVAMCGSFLTVRDDQIYIVHQSAKDYLTDKAYSLTFPSGPQDIHHEIFSRSLKVMSKTLRRDIYSLSIPGISIDQVEPPDPDPLAVAQYSCLYWVDHLLDCDTGENTNDDLKEGGSIDRFLHQSYLFWLEALSLMRTLSSGVKESPNLCAFIHDAKRFALYNQLVIDQTPLQVYCSALVFTPEKSIVRETFENYTPSWIKLKPKVQPHWNAMLQTLEGHTNEVSSVAFSPDGKQVVSGSYDGTVRLWDVVTGKQVLPALEGHTSLVTSVAFSPDGKQVVSGSYDNTVRLWDAATGKQVLPALEGHTSEVSSVAFSPDGKQVVSGSWDKTVRLWDVATGKQVLPALEGHTSQVSSVAFSPDGKQVVSGSWDKTVRLWDVVTGKQVLLALEGHTSLVTSVAFSPDGKQVVSGSYDETVRLWDVATGKQVLPALEGHTNEVSSVAFSPDGKQVVSGSYDKTVRLWDVATGKQVLPALEGHTNEVSSVAFSPDGKQVVSGSDDNTVRLWDVATGKQVLPALEGHTSEVNSVAFSPDGKQVVSGSWDGTVRLWDVATGKQVLPALEGHTSLVNSVAFSPDGKQVVSGSDDDTVRLWDVATGKQVLPALEGHTSQVNSVALSPDGKQVVSGSDDNTVRLWDTATGKQVLPALEGHTSEVSSVAFSPDGKQVVSGSRDKTVRLWDVVTGKQVLPALEGHMILVRSVAFSPDGKQVVSGSYDKTVRLWDVATGKQVLPALEGHTSEVSSVAFSPDGKQVVSGSYDNTVRLWDVATGKQVLPALGGHTVVLRPDNQTILDTLVVSNDWIIEGGVNILWLPHEYRTHHVAIWSRSVVLAQSSGKMLFLEFSQGSKSLQGIVSPPPPPPWFSCQRPLKSGHRTNN
ncbi:WD40-repeat-containing domain protein [Tricladium varicosporioides]|nr:WD40-repeat-containing domain protein [Hymenoscyphus varicosporioides]